MSDSLCPKFDSFLTDYELIDTLSEGGKNNAHIRDDLNHRGEHKPNTSGTRLDHRDAGCQDINTSISTLQIETPMARDIFDTSIRVLLNIRLIVGRMTTESQY